MNRKFIIKIVQAKRLEYEAFKELMPNMIKKPLNQFEEEIVTTARDCFFDLAFASEHKLRSENKTADATKEKDDGRKVKKVIID